MLEEDQVISYRLDCDTEEAREACLAWQASSFGTTSGPLIQTRLEPADDGTVVLHIARCSDTILGRLGRSFTRVEFFLIASVVILELLWFAYSAIGEQTFLRNAPFFEGGLSYQETAHRLSPFPGLRPDLLVPPIALLSMMLAPWIILQAPNLTFVDAFADFTMFIQSYGISTKVLDLDLKKSIIRDYLLGYTLILLPFFLITIHWSYRLDFSPCASWSCLPMIGILSVLLTNMFIFDHYSLMIVRHQIYAQYYKMRLLYTARFACRIIFLGCFTYWFLGAFSQMVMDHNLFWGRIAISWIGTDNPYEYYDRSIYEDSLAFILTYGQLVFLMFHASILVIFIVNIFDIIKQSLTIRREFFRQTISIISRDTRIRVLEFTKPVFGEWCVLLITSMIGLFIIINALQLFSISSEKWVENGIIHMSMAIDNQFESPWFWYRDAVGSVFVGISSDILLRYDRDIELIATIGLVGFALTPLTCWAILAIWALGHSLHKWARTMWNVRRSETPAPLDREIVELCHQHGIAAPKVWVDPTYEGSAETLALSLWPRLVVVRVASRFLQELQERDPSGSELRAVIAHELIHVKRHVTKLWWSQVASRLSLIGPGFLALAFDLTEAEFQADRESTCLTGDAHALRRVLSDERMIHDALQRRAEIDRSMRVSTPRGTVSVGRLSFSGSQMWTMSAVDEPSTARLGLLSRLRSVLHTVYDVYFGERLWGYCHPSAADRVANIEDL